MVPVDGLYIIPAADRQTSPPMLTPTRLMLRRLGRAFTSCSTSKISLSAQACHNTPEPVQFEAAGVHIAERCGVFSCIM